MIRQMVSYNYLGDQDEQPYYHRRQSSRNQSYSFNTHDRDLSSAPLGIYPGPRSQRFSPQENRENPQENDSNSRPRSRIPVACGRCRKRKIRCSGDSGGPCTNCKSAGNEQCQFLRVSSTETAMKCDIPPYEYEAPARLICHNIPYGPQAYRQPNPMPIESYPYRNNSISSYQYSKPMYQHFNGSFGEEGVDYGLIGCGGELLLENLGLPPNYTTSNIRGWTPAPASVPSSQQPKNTTYPEQSDVYSHAPSPFQGNGYRLNFPPEKILPLNSMPAPPPPLLATVGVDRVLPMPSANRPALIPSFLNAADGLPYSSPGMFGSTSDLSLNRIMKLNSGPASENTGTETASLADPCGSLPNNPPEAITAAHAGYNSHTLYEQQQDEVNYTTRNDSQSYDPRQLNNSTHRASISRSSHEPQGLSTPNSEIHRKSVTSLSTESNGMSENRHDYRPYFDPNHYPLPPHPSSLLPPQRPSPTMQARRSDMNGISAV